MEPGLSHIAYCSRKDAFSQLWTTRPALPAAPIRVQDEQWTGQTIKEKLCALQHALEEQRTETDEVFLLNDLSDIAWTLNLRGADVDYNPVFLSYLAYEASRSIPMPRRSLPKHTNDLRGLAWQQSLMPKH